MLSGTPNTSDPNDEICETDLTLLVGQTLPGTVNPITDVDLYAIEITSFQVGQDITFTVNETDGSFDTYLRLFDASGVPLDDDEDGGLVGNNSQIDFTFSSAGTYYLGVSTSGNEDYDPNDGSGLDTDGFSSTGSYEITYQDTNDAIDEASDELQDGNSGLFLIDFPTDVDLFRFDALVGASFQFDVSGFDGLDSQILIFDDSGLVIPGGFGDPNSPGPDAQLTVTFPETATYYVGISSSENVFYLATDGSNDSTTATNTGSYVVTATEVSLDPDDRTSDPIDLGNLFTDGTREQTGIIDSVTDVDLYRFVVGRTGSFVEIDVDVPTLGLDSLIILFDASGNEIARNEDANAPGESGTFPRDSFLSRSLTAGTYYVGVSGHQNGDYDPVTGLGDTDGNATGSYTIAVQDRLHVDTTDDTNISSNIVSANDTINTLREAIGFANTGPALNRITFKPSLFSSPQVITLGGQTLVSDQLEITDPVIIDGPGADKLSISGNNDNRVFFIDNGNDNTEIDVTIRGVTIRDGNTSASPFGASASESGAGIRNSENLTLERVSVESNRSEPSTIPGVSDDGKNGGGLLHRRGLLTIEASTFSGNVGLNGGGVSITSGDANISNSTFSGNFATEFGGGLHASNASSNITIRSSTFARNLADSDDNQTGAGGGGIAAQIANVTLHNTIVAGNVSVTGGVQVVDDTFGTFAANSSNNLIAEADATTGLSNGVDGNIIGDGIGGSRSPATVLSAVLTNNGGRTKTHALVSVSLAISSGNVAQASSLPTDQVGSPRIFRGQVDIGAVASFFDTPSLTVTTESESISSFDNRNSLREAIAFANSLPGADTVTFESSLAGETISLTQGQLTVSDSVSVAGLGADQLTISGNDNSRIFLFGSDDAATYTIADVTLTDGEVARGMEPNPEVGGAIQLLDDNDTLIIERSVISSSAANGGGAIFIGGDGAELQIADSAFINNAANFSGSAILTGGDVTATIVNSTVSGNASLNGSGALFLQTLGTESAEMILRNVTVADSTGHGLQTSAAGTSTATFTVGNSILADNTGSNFFPNGSGSSVASSIGGNVFDDAFFAAAIAGDQANEDPLLGPLADNGGPTLTHSLSPGSLAIDNGNNSIADDLEGVLLEFDQRGIGFNRIAGLRVDAGAFEAPVAVATAPVITTIVRDEGGVLARPDLISTFAVTFDQDVNVATGDLFLFNDSASGVFVDISAAGFSYDQGSFTATWTLGSLELDPAFYAFRVSSDISAVVSGMALDGNGDGTAGDSRIEEIYVAIPGDANLDGQVNVLGDAFALVGNLGTTGGATWQQGDFNGDGNVNVLGDAFVLVGNLGMNVVPPLTLVANALAISTESVASPVLFEVGGVENSSVDDAQKKQVTSVSTATPVLAGSQSLDEVFAGDDWLI